MSKATAKTVTSVTKDGKTVHFDKPVSVWQAMAQAQKISPKR